MRIGTFRARAGASGHCGVRLRVEGRLGAGGRVADACERVAGVSSASVPGSNRAGEAATALMTGGSGNGPMAEAVFHAELAGLEQFQWALRLAGPAGQVDGLDDGQVEQVLPCGALVARASSATARANASAWRRNVSCGGPVWRLVEHGGRRGRGAGTTRRWR